MIDLTMSMNLVPGTTIGLLAPVAGVIAAAALSGLAYGFAAIGYAALRRPGRRTPAARTATFDHARQAA